MKNLYLALSLGMALSSAACALKVPHMATPAPPSKETAAAETKAMEYERILGSFAIEPYQVLYLNPALCEQHNCQALHHNRLDQLAAAFKQHGLWHGAAAATLNQAVHYWLKGKGDLAYQKVTEAQASFAALADIEGLAYCYEWLGYMFHKSQATEKATEHLGIAYQLFSSLENEAAQKRILAYADSD